MRELRGGHLVACVQPELFVCYYVIHAVILVEPGHPLTPALAEGFTHMIKILLCNLHITLGEMKRI